MAKIATVTIQWTRSPSDRAHSVKLVVVNDGQQSEQVIPPEIEAVDIEVRAKGNFTFQVITFDEDGIPSPSVTYSYTLGDLEPVAPATDLRHEIKSIRDESERRRMPVTFMPTKR